ncbi:ABC transporter permease [Marilutibacter alkalisoli]|uniref:FtsX-like permease family protein n=1 Tax=Marilutibacter alkalisoli TaxID=2591633 RepID=A0A514BNQ0_9GAMM|nr:FtsX-like permease family protein [Lysobacter alkalisoli]QDH68990.1 FtsX-like permease family protein [Lysobacter alkalisoli]
MRTAGLAWRQLRRDLRAGDVRILFTALVLAVLAVTAVGFVTDRAERALEQQANRLLGGDALVRADTPIDGVIREAAVLEGLDSAETLELDSMVTVGNGEDMRLQLSELQVLGDGYPLRGGFTVRDADGIDRDFGSGPAPGTVWLSRDGADRLDAGPGDMLGIGDSRLRLEGVVVQEPDAQIDYFNISPKVYMNLADLPDTGLVQEGSRIRYRLAVAGAPQAVDAFIAAVEPKLGRGQRLQTIKDARPEVRSALDRGSRFLGLAALVSVVLAAVAVAMAARRHSERHLSGSAVMRCLGAQQRTLVAVHVGELLMLGLAACAVGVLVAYGLQWAVAGWLANALEIEIPSAGIAPVLRGFAVGLVVLLAFGAPPVLALRRVSALRVLRRDLDKVEPAAWLVAASGLLGLAALLWWQAGSVALALAMLVGLLATFAVLAALAWALILLVRRLRSRMRGSLRYGLANAGRHAGTSIAQVTALGLGLMALLLLTFVRTDLLDRWQLALAAEAPNRFIINVQQDQLDAVREFIAAQDVAPPTLFPLVQARLATHNGQAVTGEDYAGRGSRAERMAERTFNLSVADTLRDDNKVTAGTFWSGPVDAPELSVEEGFAENLGWTIGDRVGFDVAGQPFEGTITSLRSVDWESFQPNFFVVASPGALDGYPASHITAISVPPERPRFTAELVRRFPNLSVIDIDAVLDQVRSTADQVSTVVRVVFYFSLVAGVLVLMAAVSASQDERLQEGAVMRALGGSRRQLRLAQASEFAAIGLLAGLVAALAASLLSGVVAVQVFDLPWRPDWAMAAFGGGLGLLAAVAAGLFATRRVLDAPPSVTLRELDN